MSDFASTMDGNSDIEALNSLLQDMVTSLNHYILKLPSGELTLYDLFKDTPELVDLIRSSVDLWPDLIETLLYASVSDPKYIIDAVSSGDPFGYMCDDAATDLREVFDLPDDTNIEDLHDAVCSVNDTAISEELQKLLDLEGVITGNFDSSPFNLTEFMKVSNDLNVNIMNFLLNVTKFTPPEFDVNRVANTVEEFFEKVDLRDIDNLWPLLDSVLNLLYGTDASNVVSTYYRALRLVTDYVNDIFDKVDLSDMKLDVADLFPNSDHVLELLDTTFGVGPDVISGLADVTLTPKKVLFYCFYWHYCKLKFQLVV